MKEEGQRWKRLIKDNQKNFSRLHVVIDACVITLSYMFAWALRFIGPFAANAVRARSFQQYMSALVFILPAYILLYHAFSLYEPMRMQGRRLVLSNIVKANSLGILITTFILYTIEEGDISRSVLYMFYGICIGQAGEQECSFSTACAKCERKD